MLDDIQLAMAKRAANDIGRENYNYQKMLDYANGKTDILTNYPTTDFSNNIVTTNFINKFLIEECAFALGNEVTYSSKTGNYAYVDAMNEALSFIDSQNEDYVTYFNMLTFGEAYELYYTALNEYDEVVFKIRNCTPLDSRVVFNDDDVPVMFVRKYTVETKPDQFDTYYDVYTKQMIYTYNDGLNKVINQQTNLFGILPVGVAKLQNGKNSTVYNNIKSLQDAYEVASSDWMNEISDTRLSYLIIAGMSLDPETASQMRQKGILEIDADGKVEYCIKNINPEFVSKYLDNTEAKIYEIANHIQDGSMSGSNLSGTYLKNRLLMLRNKVISQNIKFKKCVSRRVQCLTNYINMINGTEYNWRDIKLTMVECVAQDDLSTAQMITQLGDLVSRETKLSLLSFVTDPATENDKALKDKEDNMIGSLLLNKAPVGDEDGQDKPDNEE